MSKEKGMGPSESNFEKRRERDERYKKLLPGEDEKPLPPPVEPIKADARQKRNEPCACGSGKKYKQCCGKE